MKHCPTHDIRLRVQNTRHSEGKTIRYYVCPYEDCSYSEQTTEIISAVNNKPVDGALVDAIIDKLEHLSYAIDDIVRELEEYGQV